jgi:hypothetical protein
MISDQNRRGGRVLRRPQVSVPITKFYRPALLLSPHGPSAHGRSSVGQAGAHPSTARALEQWIPAFAGMTVVDETAARPEPPRPIPLQRARPTCRT